MARVFNLPLSLSIGWFDISMKLDLTSVLWKCSVAINPFSHHCFVFSESMPLHAQLNRFISLGCSFISSGGIILLWISEFTRNLLGVLLHSLSSMCRSEAESFSSCLQLEKKIWETSFMILLFLVGGSEHFVMAACFFSTTLWVADLFKADKL